MDVSISEGGAGDSAAPGPPRPVEKDGPARDEATSARDEESGDQLDARRPEQRPEPVRPSGDVDVEMLRRSWPTLVERLKTTRQMVLFSYIQSVTPVSFEGNVLELAFPPGQPFGVQKVEGHIDKLQEALNDVFGISPQIKCVIRDSAVGGVAVLEDDDEPAPDEEAALERLKAELNAEIADD
jgi:DNA polymerase III subunit gamma/tau